MWWQRSCRHLSCIFLSRLLFHASRCTIRSIFNAVKILFFVINTFSWVTLHHSLIIFLPNLTKLNCPQHLLILLYLSPSLFVIFLISHNFHLIQSKTNQNFPAVLGNEFRKSWAQMTWGSTQYNIQAGLSSATLEIFWQYFWNKLELSCAKLSLAEASG